MSKKIVVIPGDGIGQEITDSAVAVLKKVSDKYNLNLEFESHPAGGTAYSVGDGDHRQQHERPVAAGAAPDQQPHCWQAGLVVCHVGGGAGDQGAQPGLQG